MWSRKDYILPYMVSHVTQTLKFWKEVMQSHICTRITRFFRFLTEKKNKTQQGPKRHYLFKRHTRLNFERSWSSNQNKTYQISQWLVVENAQRALWHIPPRDRKNAMWNVRGEPLLYKSIFCSQTTCKHLTTSSSIIILGLISNGANT